MKCLEILRKEKNMTNWERTGNTISNKEAMHRILTGQNIPTAAEDNIALILRKIYSEKVDSFQISFQIFSEEDFSKDKKEQEQESNSNGD